MRGYRSQSSQRPSERAFQRINCRKCIEIPSVITSPGVDARTTVYCTSGASGTSAKRTSPARFPATNGSATECSLLAACMASAAASRARRRGGQRRCPVGALARTAAVLLRARRRLRKCPWFLWAAQKTWWTVSQASPFFSAQQRPRAALHGMLFRATLACYLASCSSRNLIQTHMPVYL